MADEGIRGPPLVKGSPYYRGDSLLRRLPGRIVKSDVETLTISCKWLKPNIRTDSLDVPQTINFVLREIRYASPDINIIKHLYTPNDGGRPHTIHPRRVLGLDVQICVLSSERRGLIIDRDVGLLQIGTDALVAVEVVNVRGDHNVGRLDRNAVQRANSLFGQQDLAPAGNHPDRRRTEVEADLNCEVRTLRIGIAVLVLTILDVPSILDKIIHEFQRDRDGELTTTFLIESRSSSREIQEEQLTVLDADIRCHSRFPF
nr:MAG TPA: hypothetical protein [Caudoviricetes sp.]